MRFVTFLFSLIIPAGFAAAQSLPVLWTSDYKPQGKCSDRAAVVKTDSHGNILVAGYAGREFGYPDVFVIKYSPAGDTLWTYYYAGPIYEEDKALDLVTDAQDNVYLSGYSTNSNYSDECVAIKLDSGGSEQWVNRYTGPGGSESHGNAIAVDDSGNVYVAGYYDPPLAGKSLLVIKYNPNGSVQWSDVSNAPSSITDEATDIAISPSGNATVCGTNSGTGTSYNIFVKQYTRGGDTTWTASWNNAAYNSADYATAMCFAANGELRISGITYNGSVKRDDIVVLSYDAAGQLQWATIYTDATTNSNEYGNGMTVDAGGNVFVAGMDFANQLIYRVNADGSQGWKRSWRGPLPGTSDVAFAVATDAGGNVYAAGKGIYPGPNYFGNNGLDLFTVTKYSGAGDSLWTWRQGSTTDISIGFAITTQGSRVIAAGFKADTAYADENFLTVVLDTAGPVQHEWAYSGIGDAIVRGQVVRTDAAGNVYAAGTSNRLYNDTYDVTLVKYDPAGNILWTRNYTQGWRNDTLTGMELDPAGNVLLSVSTDTGGTGSSYKVSVVKFNPDGVLLHEGWYNGVAGSVFAEGMAVRSDGGVYVGCNTNPSGGTVISFDSTLAFQWAVPVDTAFPPTRFLRAIAVFPNNDVAVTGIADSGSFSNRKIFVQRMTPAGLRQWTSDIDSAGVRDEPYDITVNAADDIAVAGLSGSVALAARLSGSGQLTWRTAYNPATTSERGIRVRFAPSGSVVMLTDAFNGFVNRWYTAQFDTAGAQQWATGYSVVASDRYPLQLLVRPDGSVVTGGFQISGNVIPNYDYTVVGYSVAGAQVHLNTFSTSGYFPDRLRSLTADTAGNILVTGESSSSFLNDYRYRMVTIKYGNLPVGLTVPGTGLPAAVAAWPNPSATGRFTVNLPARKSATGVRIYDLTGRLVLQPPRLRDGDVLDLSFLPRGLYIAWFDDGTGIRLVRE